MTTFSLLHWGSALHFSNLANIYPSELIFPTIPTTSSPFSKPIFSHFFCYIHSILLELLAMSSACLLTQAGEQEMQKSTPLCKYCVGGRRNSKLCVCSARKAAVPKSRGKNPNNQTTHRKRECLEENTEQTLLRSSPRPQCSPWRSTSKL